MPRRGRHRTSLPTRLIATVAALLVTAGVVVAAGSAAAQSDSGSGNDSGGGLLSSITGSSGEGSSDEASGDSQDSQGQGEDGSDSGDNGDSGNGQDGQEQDGDQGSDQNGDEQSGDDQNGDDQNGQDGQEDQNGQNGQDDQNGQDQNADEGDQGGDDNGGQQAAAADPFPGRDQIANASGNDYVNIQDVDQNNNIGDGGVFNGGSYTVDCGVSDHNNSDNYMAAPGKRNGAQHVHDYVGNQSTNANSDDDSLEAAGTSCENGDRSTFFWPVLRDRTGTGPDVGRDGGSLDGNVGRILTPTSADLTFHGHGDQQIQPLPRHLMMIMGNAKQGAQNGDNVNSKYTCSGFTDRVTDRYPVCPAGSNLMRILDYPSCWDGQNLESKNFRDHMAFPDEQGNCSDGFQPIPALRITLTYDVRGGQNFQIDSFPNEQHDPRTDHSDFENLATEAQNNAGVECIRGNRQCTNV